MLEDCLDDCHLARRLGARVSSQETLLRRAPANLGNASQDKHATGSTKSVAGTRISKVAGETYSRRVILHGSVPWFQGCSYVPLSSTVLSSSAI